MIEKPILFSGEMVRAILDGRKTQTRRVIKPQPERVGGGWMYAGQYFADDGQMKNYLFHDVYGNGKCPYGGVYADGTAEWLWVRETWAAHVLCPEKPSELRPGTRIWYRATHAPQDEQDRGPWRPSIFMPRWASRLTLQVMDVRIERVQEISEDDAKAEGVNPMSWTNRPENGLDYTVMFWALWDRLNAERGYSWDSNPWVWVVKFEQAG